MLCRTSSRPAMEAPYRRYRRRRFRPQAGSLGPAPGQGGRTKTRARVKLAPAARRLGARLPPHRAPAAGANFKEQGRVSRDKRCRRRGARARAPPDRQAPARGTWVSIQGRRAEARPAIIPVPPRRRATWRPSPTPDCPPAPWAVLKQRIARAPAPARHRAPAQAARRL
jgi:hypothetical protein